MYCSQCGTSNEDTAKFCASCGTATSRIAGKVPVAQNLDEQNSVELYKAIIGPANQDYYLKQFARFDKAGGASITWHWPAFFVTIFWLLSRKMWLNTVLYIFLLFLPLIPLAIVAAVFDKNPAFIEDIYSFYWFAMYMLPAMFANALYYRYCKKKIEESAASSRSHEEQLGKLKSAGGFGTGPIVTIFLILLAVPIIGILAAVALPAYQDYTTRARVTSALIEGRYTTASVASHFYQHQGLPTSLESAGIQAPANIDYNSENGTVIFTVPGESPIKGKSILLVPSLDSNEKIIWTCMTEEVPSRYLPAACRTKK